ncbi:EamA-like transporter family protein [Salmonella enterica]|uniref:EamA-like transporter family protein n=1 Tax=Salmonella enterica TaxID=28901 RepID=A0A5Z4XHD0_SALER|nr:EamA-like transporter family protein [Salmonella enterica subsp. enterica]EAM1889523.1 EamA-like transporter family protein [Salmonella enterica]EBR9850087.1 EamA-like transporter family protein [Salmonella enterica subsp. enterica serovar Newport]EBW6384775.1 EamA-like transporter family protein [Salmonella enterica subsp. enterica serovar Stanley]EDS3545701.1 EamA-like transporter family protein [Salmonella enterica subsp. enterica serovar Kentucky]EEE1279885.1 EamA-like transporter famil
MNQSLTLIFLIAAGVGLVVQNSIMVRITQTSSTILIAMLLNSLVGIVLFVTILWFKQGATGFGELVASQLIGGLALDIARSHGVTLRAMVGPAFGALLLVIGAWLIAKRQF